MTAPRHGMGRFGVLLLLMLSGLESDAFGQTFTCPVEPAPGSKITAAKNVQGGGMTGDGWEGSGANATVVYWHMESVTADISAAAQRQAYINALQTWANQVQITFIEVPIADYLRSIDWAFTLGDHCALEPAECGDSDCAFGATILGHAGYPPGVNSECISSMDETFAGNVHFNDAIAFSQNWEVVGNPSLQSVAAHEVGHALGLTHDTGAGGPHIMAPNYPGGPALAPSASDIANIRVGYAAGAGEVRTLETTGIHLESGFPGAQNGTLFFPFATVAQGVAGVPPGSSMVNLLFRPGVYPGAITIDRPMILKATGGGVALGGP